jgi:predicted choloylglycine hydrolase
VLILASAAPAAKPAAFRFPAGKHGTGAELKFINQVPVLTVAGTPEEMGTAAGALALKPGARVLEYPRDLLEAHKGKFLWGLFVRTGRGMFKTFPDDYKKELEAVVKGAKAERDLVIAGNTFFDIARMFTCSAVMVDKTKSATGGTLLGRNLDYPSLGYTHQYSLVTVYRPKGKLAFASIGFPGLVGVLSGMNEAGLALGVLEVFDAKGSDPNFEVKGTPYALCLRRVLEQARTIDEAKKVLEGMRRTTMINVAIADRKDVAVLEVTPTKVVKRSAQQGACFTTNHFNSRELKPENPVNVQRSFERYARLGQVSTAKEKFDVAALGKHLDAVNLGKRTLQTMVFEPDTLRLHLAIGTVPASKGPLRRIDLAELLRPVARGGGQSRSSRSRLTPPALRDMTRRAGRFVPCIQGGRGLPMSRRSFVVAVGIVLFLACSVGTALILLLHYEPHHHRICATPPGEERVRSSQEFYKAFFDMLGGMDGKGTWEGHFTDKQINSYLNEAFIHSGLSEKLLPEGISEPRVRFEEEGMRLSFRYRSRLINTVVSIKMSVWLPHGEPNVVALRLESIQAGLVPFTAQWLLERISDAARNNSIDVTWYRFQGHPVALLRFQADQARPTLQLRDVRFEPGRIVIQGGSTETKAEGPGTKMRLALLMAVPSRS